MWGACSVWGWRMEMEKNPLSSAKPGPPPGPGSFLWASPSPFDRHRTEWWREGREEGFGSKLIAIWRRFRAVLSRLFQSRRNAFPCKLCKVLCKQKELMAILGDYLPSVHDRSIQILIRTRQLNFNEWAIGLQKEWQWSVGDTRRNQEYFSSNTCDLWPCDCFMFYQSGEWARWKPLLMWGML